MARYGAGKFLTGIAHRRDCGRAAVLDEWRDVLRHVGEYAQGSHAGDRDDRTGAWSAGSGVCGDKVSGIDVARSHDAVEGRGDRLVSLIGDVLLEGGARL